MRLLMNNTSSKYHNFWALKFEKPLIRTRKKAINKIISNEQ